LFSPVVLYKRLQEEASLGTTNRKILAFCLISDLSHLMLNMRFKVDVCCGEYKCMQGHRREGTAHRKEPTAIKEEYDSLFCPMYCCFALGQGSCGIFTHMDVKHYSKNESFVTKLTLVSQSLF